MFWIGVSVLVMSMTGLGDDTRPLLEFIRDLQEAAAQEVPAPDRSAEVHSALDDFRDAYFQHRKDLGDVGDCIEKLDRTYAVTVEDYEACAEGGSRVMDDAATALIETRARIQAATTPDERKRVRARLLSK